MSSQSHGGDDETEDGGGGTEDVHPGAGSLGMRLKIVAMDEGDRCAFYAFFRSGKSQLALLSKSGRSCPNVLQKQSSKLPVKLFFLEWFSDLFNANTFSRGVVELYENNFNQE